MALIRLRPKGRSNPTFEFRGKTRKGALSAARKYIATHRNIFAGFRDEDGIFHPIRASKDYSPSRAGEKRKKKSRRRRRR
jgi:hypothetical protein